MGCKGLTVRTVRGPSDRLLREPVTNVLEQSDVGPSEIAVFMCSDSES